MSRQIDLTKPLSEEDRVYLEDRADIAALTRNAAYLAGKEFSSSDAAVDPMAVDRLENATDQPAVPVVEDEVLADMEQEADEQAAVSKKK